MSIIDELGAMALSARLVRLGETIRRDVTRIYKEHGLPFESKWFPVLYVLTLRSPLSLTELADELGYTHPSVIALVREMETAKLVRSEASRADARKRMLSLTPKAKAMKEELEPLWNTMTCVAYEIIETRNNLLKAIEETETLLAAESFYDRYAKLKSAATARKVTAEKPMLKRR